MAQCLTGAGDSDDVILSVGHEQRVQSDILGVHSYGLGGPQRLQNVINEYVASGLVKRIR